MIESIYLELIILLLLVWLFENKIFPQIIIIFISLAMMINQITIATNLKNILGIVVLYAVIILYSAWMTTKDED
jgi:energy-coupling factor transporter transmembrane protein EcfT